MVILLDTNVLFDVLSKRQPHYASSNQILRLCRRNAIVGAVACHTVANVFYYYGKPATPFLKQRLLIHLSVHAASSGTIQDVLRWGMNDWEDVLQTAAAETAQGKLHRHSQREGFQILPRAGAEPKRFSQALSPGLGQGRRLLVVIGTKLGIDAKRKLAGVGF